jgi:hypothetical protein
MDGKEQLDGHAQRMSSKRFYIYPSDSESRRVHTDCRFYRRDHESPVIGLLQRLACKLVLTRSKRSPRHPTALAWLCLGGTLLLGCTANSERGGSPPDSSSGAKGEASATQPRAARPTAIIGASMLLRSEVEGALSTAWSKALSTCAGQAGIDYSPAPPPVARSTGGLDGVLGLSDGSLAARNGYLVALQGKDPGLAGDPVNALPPGEIAALDVVIHGQPNTRESLVVTDTDGNSLGGIETGQGCLRSFYTKIFGSFDDYLLYLSADLRIQNANTLAQDALQADPRFIDLVVAWSTCMSDSGFEYLSPIGPFSSDWPSPRPADEEIQVAVADMACKDATGFLDSARAIRDEVQARVGATLQIEVETRTLSNAGRRVASFTP